MPHPFSDYLRSVMQARGFNASRVASAVTAAGSPTSTANVRSWLRGSLPSDDRRAAIAAALGVRLEELATRCAGETGPVRSVPFREPGTEW